jgi:hypothetical protein
MYNKHYVKYVQCRPFTSFGNDGSNNLRPIGIVIEGSPGGSSAWNERDPSTAFLTPNDIVITGLTLSPDRFHRWLQAVGCFNA